MHLPSPSSLPLRHYDSCDDIDGGIFSGGSHGRVTVHPSVAIAPTALLQAEPGSHLILAAGVCVGAGAVLHAYGGTLEIESGVSLGAAVLLIGSGKIGANACVGSMVTMINPAIAPGDVIAAGTLLGDDSRGIELSPKPPPEPSSNPSPEPSSKLFSEPSPKPLSAQNGAASNGKLEAHTPDSPAEQRTQPVTGKAALNELMTALFPHRQHFDQS